MNIIISEIIKVKVNGQWYDAEVLDITESSVYVYIFDLRIKKNISISSTRNAEMTAAELTEREARRAATRTQIVADQRTGTKRDAKALAREAAWLRKFGQV